MCFFNSCFNVSVSPTVDLKILLLTVFFSWADLLDVGMMFLLEFFCVFSKLVLGWSVFLPPSGMLPVYRGEPSFLLFC